MTMRRVDWTINVEYGVSAEDTKKLLMDLLNSEPRILKKETGAPSDPFVALSALSASSVDFVLKAWVKSEDYWNVKFSMNEKIYAELPKNGINFPFPQMDVHVHHKA